MKELFIILQLGFLKPLKTQKMSTKVREANKPYTVSEKKCVITRQTKGILNSRGFINNPDSSYICYLGISSQIPEVAYLCITVELKLARILDSSLPGRIWLCVFLHRKKRKERLFFPRNETPHVLFCKHQTLIFSCLTITFAVVHWSFPDHAVLFTPWQSAKHLATWTTHIHQVNKDFHLSDKYPFTYILLCPYSKSLYSVYFLVFRLACH